MERISNKDSQKDLFPVFLKLGIFGFGGPAAHIAMMREEIVEKRHWFTNDEFFDLVGATNLIPGPNSTELAIHIGHKMGGWRGLLIAGISFILPAFVAVLSLAVLYVQYGTLPQLNSILMGIRPVVVGIVIMALWKFRESAVRNLKELTITLLTISGMLLGLNEIALIFISGLLLAASFKAYPSKLTIVPFLFPASTTLIAISSLGIFSYFVKVGSVLFGSGYVLLAFLQNDLVDGRGWLTNAQLLDAITVGQVTPGPVFTTATFVGYLLQGYTGAILATVGIFLPAFFFVAISAPFISKLRTSSFFSHFLNGVNASSFGLMLLVTLELGSKSLFNFPTFLIGLVSLLILKFTKLNSAWPILVGGAIGFFIF